MVTGTDEERTSNDDNKKNTGTYKSKTAHPSITHLHLASKRLSYNYIYRITLNY